MDYRHKHISFFCQLRGSRSNNISVAMNVFSTKIMVSNSTVQLKNPGLRETSDAKTSDDSRTTQNECGASCSAGELGSAKPKPNNPEDKSHNPQKRWYIQRTQKSKTVSWTKLK